MGELIDISPEVGNDTPVWPGTVAFYCDKDSVTTTLHVGAHADAPAHLFEGGRSMSECELETYYGPCRVIEAMVEPGGRMGPEFLPESIGAPRVLVKTGHRARGPGFPEDFAGLSEEFADRLAERGVLLVGIDTPSVDPFEDRELRAHAALGRHGIAILEGLDLSRVSPGLYTLIALPLRMKGADGSPVRAALVTY